MVLHINARVLSAGLALAVLAVMGVMSLSVSEAEIPSAERPTYQLGDKWHRSDGTFVLTRIDGQTYVFGTTDAREIHLSRDLTILKVVEGGVDALEFDPALPLKWPLRVGTWGQVKVTWKSSETAKRIPSLYTWKVEAFESVKLLGKQFKAFRIVQSWGPDDSVETNLTGEVMSLGAYRTRQLVTWYVPDLRQLVKGEGTEWRHLTFEITQPPPAGQLAAETPTPRPAEPAKGVLYEPTLLLIDVRYPADLARLDQPTTVVASVISSVRGVASVRISVNGTEVHRESDTASKQKSVAVSVPITLREGANAVVVTAEEPNGTVRHEMRTVFYDAPQAAAKTPRVEPTLTGERWAVIIGVGRYSDRRVPQLRYASADAEAVYRQLTERAGFQKDHVELLTDHTERKPTLRNIKSVLGTFLARRPKREDTVLIFFAGHGAPEVDPRGVEPDGLAKYLVPADADPDDLYSTALAMDELQNVFARIEAERVVAFLDTCYSGAAGGRSFLAKRTRSSHVDDIFLERLARTKGRVIITASRPNEVSLELAEFGHGLFTYYLLRGMEGAADIDQDGTVSLQELYQYVQQQVITKSRAEGGSQHPIMKGEVDGVMPLVKLRRR